MVPWAIFLSRLRDLHRFVAHGAYPQYQIPGRCIKPNRATTLPPGPLSISGPIIRINRHYKTSVSARSRCTPTRTQRTVLVAEIAEPITGLLPAGPLPAAAQVDTDLEVLLGEDLRRAPLVHGLGLPGHDEAEGRRPVGRDEADGCPGGDHRLRGGQTLRVADGAEDAAPVGVFAVEGGFDQGVAGDG